MAIHAHAGHRTVGRRGRPLLRRGDGHVLRTADRYSHLVELPRLHSAHALPNARGAIEVGDQAFVLFTLTGLSNLTDGAGIHVLTFMTEHKPHLWLNEVIAIGEGGIDVAAGALSMRHYSCHVDYRPDLTGVGNM